MRFWGITERHKICLVRLMVDRTKDVCCEITIHFFNRKNVPGKLDTLGNAGDPLWQAIKNQLKLASLIQATQVKNHKYARGFSTRKTFLFELESIS